MKTLSRRVAVITVLAVLLGLFAVPAGAQGDIRVVLGGTTITFDVPPMLVNGRVLVPLRKIFEALGAEVTYDPATRTIDAARGSTRVRLTVGSTEATVNGKPVPLSEPPQVVNGRTLVPLRAVSEMLGGQVAWDGASQTVTISPAPTGPGPAGLRAEDAVLRPDDLSALREMETMDGPSENGWHRAFMSAGPTDRGYPLIGVRMIRPASGAEQWIEANGCRPDESAVPFTQPTLWGDASKMCRPATREGSLGYLTVAIAWHDWVFVITTYTLDPQVDLAAAQAFLLEVAQAQLAVATRLAEGETRPSGQPAAQPSRQPAGQPPAPPVGQPPEPPPPPPAQAQPGLAPAGGLTVTAGQDFEHSFCAPKPARPTALCGTLTGGTTSPTGGFPPYHFRTEGGFPPFGLKLNLNGLLTGRVDPRARPGDYSFTVCAVDLLTKTTCQQVTLTVVAPLSFTAPATLPPATEGVRYEYSFCDPACGQGAQNPTGGQPPYLFQLESEHPPAGLRLDASGRLSGQPVPGTGGTTYRFKVCVLDSLQNSACQEVALPVARAALDAEQYENTSWNGTFTIIDVYEDDRTYTGSFTFSLGARQEVCPGGDWSNSYCGLVVPVTGGQLTYRGLTFGLKSRDSFLICGSMPGVGKCNGFMLYFDFVSGKRPIGTDSTYFFVGNVRLGSKRAVEQLISPTAIKGWSGTACCSGGAFTATRR